MNTPTMRVVVVSVGLTAVLVGCSVHTGRVHAAAPDIAARGWVQTPAPSAERGRCALLARRSWVVTAQEGRVGVHALTAVGEPRPPELRNAQLPGWPMHYAAVEGGFLVGADAGEFGGWLRWYSPDGGTWRSVSDWPTMAIVVVGRDRAIALRRAERGGAVEWVQFDGSAWAVNRSVSFDAEPVALGVAPGRILVLTSAGVFAAGDAGRLETISLLQSSSLLPSSVAADGSGAVWVGMRDFVLRIEPPEKTGSENSAPVTWWAPKGCISARIVGKECICNE